MRIYAEHFMFDGTSTEALGFVLCSFEDPGGYETTSAGSALEITTAKPIKHYKWNSFGQEYANPLSFRVQIVKIDGAPVQPNERTMINRWLIRNDGFKEFQFQDRDYADVLYYARASSINEISVGGLVRGFEIEFTTSSPFGYSPVLTKRFRTLVDQQEFTFYNQSEEYGYLYPKMTITLYEDCDFSIRNKIEDREFLIKNCQKGEIITVDNEMKLISTSSFTHKIHDNFNWKWFRFFCKDARRHNNLIITGQSLVEMNYQIIRKLGVES